MLRLALKNPRQVPQIGAYYHHGKNIGTAALQRPRRKMDFIFDILINLLAYRVGLYVLRLLSGGRFKGESGFAWGWALAVGSLVLSTPFVALIAWLIHTSGR
jgi:hypothetical protein